MRIQQTQYSSSETFNDYQTVIEDLRELPDVSRFNRKHLDNTSARQAHKSAD